MNTQTFFAAALTTLALAAGSAFAGEATYEYPATHTSSVTRAEVKAETVRAYAAGQISSGERSFVIVDTSPSLSRAQVKAEAREAIRVGAISIGEHTVFPTAAQLESIRLAGQKAAAIPMASL